MGVPSFYRWLVNKYPKIVSNAAAGGENPPTFDNLYLDMNGIIHPCFHPDNNPFPPTTFEEVFRSMHDYIDHLFDIVRPQKLLFMAIDGVAPRAKMNQQRARRFRAAKDAEIAEELEERLRKQFEYEGKVVLPKEDSQLTDTNVITPGTEFMDILSRNLRGYISQRMNENPAWGNIMVILSDDKVPGEGEHKIMSFIRAQRALPGYDPNTRHCLYGLDADLIMLSLATHELHFSILREEVLPPNRERSNVNCAENGGCEPGTESAKLASCQEAIFRISKQKAYQFLNVSILREYISLDMEIPSLDQSKWDLERIIDDFIFICFFAGNDFLPHIPSLEIHEGCLDLLMHVYKKEFQNLGGYLVNMEKVHIEEGGYIKLKRVERFILAVGDYEEKIFSKRTNLRDRKLNRMLAEYRDAKDDDNSYLDDGTSSEIIGMYSNIARIDGLKISAPASDADTVLQNTKELKQKLKDNLRNQSDLFKDGTFGTDKVKLNTPGWRQRYYTEKFSAEDAAEMETMRRSVVAKYGEGLCWVLLYYFSGVPSWTWFYTYHYSPFASDFRGLSQTKVKFTKGIPFNPFDQLMGVLPPRSSHALPKAYRGLMVDENSGIIDFYPTKFEVDVDGKRFIWQGICKLPFIEEERLLLETRKLDNELETQEMIRNSQTLHLVFLRGSTKFIQQLLPSNVLTDPGKIKGAIASKSEIGGVEVTHLLMRDDLVESDEHIYECSSDPIWFSYEIPQGLRHIPRLLEGVNIPEKTVYEDDIEETILWHEQRGNNMLRNRQPDFVSARNHPPAYGPDGADRGFNFGRGKGSACALPLHNPNYYPRNSPVPAYRLGGEYNTSIPPYQNYGFSGYQPTPCNPRAGPFQINDRGGSQGFQNSGSSHCSSSNPWQFRANCEDWGLEYTPGDSWQNNYVDRTAPGMVYGRMQPSNHSFVANGGQMQPSGRSYAPNVGPDRGPVQASNHSFVLNGAQMQPFNQSYAPDGSRCRGPLQPSDHLLVPTRGQMQPFNRSYAPDGSRGRGPVQPSDHSFVPNGGQLQPSNHSYTPNGGRGRGPMQPFNHSFAPNGGRGLGPRRPFNHSSAPSVGRGEGPMQPLYHSYVPNRGQMLPSDQAFVPNGGRGGGRGSFAPDGGHNQGRWYSANS